MQYPSTLLLTFLATTFGPWGADSDLVDPPPPKQQTAPSLPVKACQGAVRFFQVYISPIDGPRSTFYPTSSQYALDAITKYGVLQGIAMGCDRLLRENHERWVYPTISGYGPERKHDPVR